MEVENTAGPADLADMREKLGNAGLGEIALQGYADPKVVQIRLQYQTATPAELEQAKQQLTSPRITRRPRFERFSAPTLQCEAKTLLDPRSVVS
jgi:hypothetical protein